MTPNPTTSAAAKPSRIKWPWILAALAIAIIIGQAFTIARLVRLNESFRHLPERVNLPPLGDTSYDPDTNSYHLGRLNRSLGSKAVIVGHLDPQSHLINWDLAPFIVAFIDGVPCEPRVIFVKRENLNQFEPTQSAEPKQNDSAQTMGNFQPDVDYELTGWESGEYYSAPRWAGPGLQQPFQFSLYFIVHSLKQL